MLIDENTQKAILSLVSVVVGWFLGQGTSLIRNWWNNRRLKKALLIELEDLRKRLLLIGHTYERKLQIYALEGFEADVPLKLTHAIYTKYYSEVFFKLNHAQRSSYELIHGYVEAINKGIDHLSELALNFAKEVEAKRLEEWADAVKAQYYNVRTMYWHINFHLNNKRNPDLGDIYSEQHKEFLKAIDKSHEAIEDITKKAKGLNREDFMRAYREEDFTPFE